MEPVKAGRRRPTLADVARRAGVSTATVSYVLNGRPGVREDRRLAVLRAAGELGFRPNLMAKALRRGRSHVFGLLLGELSNPLYWDFAQSVMDTAARHDRHVLFAHTGDEAKDAEARELVDHQVDGLIVTTAVEADRPLLQELALRQVPVVLASRALPGRTADYVGVDQRAAAREIAEHLLALGHRTFGIVGGPSSSASIVARVETYRETVDAAGRSRHPAWEREGPPTQAAGYEMAREVLGDPGHRPRALLCANDLLALGAIDAAADLRLRVPEDVAIVGFDDIAMASARPIGLTSVGVPQEEMGRVAVELLLERIEHPEQPPREVVLPHRLVVRRTSGAAPRDRG